MDETGTPQGAGPAFPPAGSEPQPPGEATPPEPDLPSPPVPEEGEGWSSSEFAPGPFGGPPPADTAAAPAGRSLGKVIVGVVIAVAIISAGIAIGVNRSSGKTPTTAPSSPLLDVTGSPSAPATPLPPVGLAASVKGLTVSLSWSTPSGTVAGYKIYRDGELVSTTPPTTTTYVDQFVLPGSSHTYEVETRGDGLLVSSRASLATEIPVPPLSSARLEGTFNAKVKTTSQYGYLETLTGLTFGWSFTPKCSAGACDVTWKDLTYAEMRTVLHRKGVTYSGSDSGKFFGTCGSVRTSSSVTLEVHVVKARAVGGEWRATKLVGTMVESHAPQLGCTSGSAHFDVTLFFNS